MHRTPLVAGNWKMHKTVAEGLQLAKAMLPGLQALDGVESLICPPATALMPMSALLDGSGIALGAQNLHWEAGDSLIGQLVPHGMAEFCS